MEQDQRQEERKRQFRLSIRAQDQISLREKYAQNLRKDRRAREVELRRHTSPAVLTLSEEEAEKKAIASLQLRLSALGPAMATRVSSV